jgi:hypothetical protein
VSEPDRLGEWAAELYGMPAGDALIAKAARLRDVACAAIVAAPLPPARVLLQRITAATLGYGGGHADSMRLAARWLAEAGLAPKGTDHYRLRDQLTAAGDHGGLQRYAYAYALAGDETRVRSRWQTWGLEHIEHFERLASSGGHEPTPWEQAPGWPRHGPASRRRHGPGLRVRVPAVPGPVRPRQRAAGTRVRLGLQEASSRCRGRAGWRRRGRRGGDPMRALSLRQPWAWAVAVRQKSPENRTWRPTSGVPEDIAIHAAAAYEDGVFIPVLAAARKLRALEAEVRLAGRCVPAASHLRTRRIVAVVTYTGAHWWEECGTSAPRGQSPGTGTGQMEAPRPLPQPVYCKGALGLWALSRSTSPRRYWGNSTRPAQADPPRSPHRSPASHDGRGAPWFARVHVREYLRTYVIKGGRDDGRSYAGRHVGAYVSSPRKSATRRPRWRPGLGCQRLYPAGTGAGAESARVRRARRP